MRKASLFVVVALIVTVCVTADWYEVVPGSDAPNKDIKHLDTNNVGQLESACNAIPTCVGFNTDGWLKNDVTQISSAPCDLYVRRSGPAPPSVPYLWPVPQKYTNGSTTITLTQNFKIQSTSTSQVITLGISRYTDLVLSHGKSGPASGSTLSTLTIYVLSTDETLQLETDESYSLSVTATSANITANTVYGALHGLETFSQLVRYNFISAAYEIANGPWDIQDAPRFPHRGLLVDTTRHFEPVRTLKTVIDSLTYAKLNVLHWHVVDSQSFPMQFLAYPNLWNGAYPGQARFTQQDVSEVVEYARLRGIRVMIEFDVPGHAASWCTGYPDACPSPTCLQPLDPSNEFTFQLLTGIVQESTMLFPEKLFHLGGDEVDTSCWTQTPHIQAWLTQKGYTPDQAYMYFVERAHQIVIPRGRQPVNWEEVFNHFGSQLDKETIVHVWLDHATLAKVVAAGYRGLLSNSDVWYLDHLDVTWEQFYANEPFQGITDPAQQKLVLGGEVCMWGETVDSSDMFNTVWPRAAAAAERLWSPQSYTDTDAALPRLEWFRCFLNNRGIDAAPTLNKEARLSPPGPGACLYQ